MRILILFILLSPALAFSQDWENPGYIPNVYTESCDYNDPGFKPYFPDSLELDSYRLRIYNRWGELMFETTDPTKGWKPDHKEVPQDIYTWQIVYTEADGITKEFRGHFTYLI